MAQMQRVEVLRAFRHRREIYAPPSVLDLEAPIAIEMRAANKVKFVHTETPKTHTSELQDPNKVMAARSAARAAASVPVAQSSATVKASDTTSAKPATK